MKKRFPELAAELVVYFSISSIVISTLYYIDTLTR